MPRVLFSLFFLFLLSASAAAQKSTISGIIYSQEGEVLENAYLALQSNENSTAAQTTVSDSNGGFYMDEIEAGNYTLFIQNLGFKSKELKISISAGEHITRLIYLAEEVYQSEFTVVTASRTVKELEDVSVPVSVIGQKDLKMNGSTRLGEVLASQTGLNVVSDHGKGIQVQGFDPEYTLILIDNQPVLGRTAGTLDLDRLTIGDIQQIEIVKGPSSALWGSDALAGVINIITKKSSEPFQWDISGQYGSNYSYDGSTNVSFRQNKISGRFFGNINGSNGFDLNPQNISKTVPEHQSYTFSGSLDHKISSNITLELQSRYYLENLNFLSDLSIDNITHRISGSEYQENYSITPQINFHLGPKQLLEATYFYSRYNSKNVLTFYNSPDLYDQSKFNQQLHKYELKSSTFWNTYHTTVFGIGMKQEELVSQRYVHVPDFKSYFAFGQHEWSLSDAFSFMTGFRLDFHSEYSSQLSPKFSSLYKINDLIHVRASFGGGFKAPGFSELYLNYTNPQVGYSVFGSSTVVEGIRQLQNEGQIKTILIEPETIGGIEAEHSYAFNAGIDLYPANGLQIRMNIFRNNVRDMLETQRIAIKNNDQSVFSYFNLNKIYTQGVETEIRFDPPNVSNLNITLGYQYLDAKRQITRQYDDVVDGEVISKNKKEFIPLFNRSKHNLNARIYHEIKSLGIESSLRLKFRGSSWFADEKVNKKIDAGELSEAHLLIDYSLAKTIQKRIRLQVGVNNITNYRDALYLPSNPGITFYSQLNIQLY